MASPSIQKWLNNQAQKKEKATLIEYGLLTGSMGGYYWYRLRYFTLRTLLAAIIFAIEVKILVIGLGVDALTYALGPRILIGLLTSGWWASLENMRSEIRKEKREEKPYLIPKIILSWLNYSKALSQWVGVGGLGLVCIAVALTPDMKVGPLTLYWISLLLRLCIEIPLRTYHSSVYATRRIYRPLVWIIFSEILGFALFLGLRPSIGAWSVGISALITLLSSTLISYHYISKTFKYLGYKKAIEEIKEKMKSKKYRQQTYEVPNGYKLIKDAVPLSLFRLDSILTLFLISSQIGAVALSANPTSSNDPKTTLSLLSIATIAVCLPILQAAQEWSQLLYFDYKRLELKTHKYLKERFSYGIPLIILSMSILLWLFTPILSWIVTYQWQLPSAEMLILFVGASFCGQQAMRIFSLGSKKELLQWGLSVLACLVGIFIMLWGQNDLNKTILFSGIALAANALGMSIFCKENEIIVKELIIPPTQWVYKLRQSKFVWGGWLLLYDLKENDLDNSAFLKREIARVLNKESRRKIVVTSTNKRSLCFFCEVEENNLEKLFSETDLAIATLLEVNVMTKIGHLIKQSHIVKRVETPESLLEKLSQSEFVLKYCTKPQSKHTWTAPPKETISIDLMERNKKKINLTSTDCQEILGGALRYHKTLGIKGDWFCKNWDVCTEESQGSITKIFATPKTVNKNILKSWRTFITDRNLYKAWNNGNDNEINQEPIINSQ